MKCPLCGHEFDRDNPAVTGKCRGCPIGRICRLICCPKCGYTLPPERKKKIASSTMKSEERQ